MSEPSTGLPSEVEGRQMAFFLQGALVAGASQFASANHGALRQPVRIEQPVSADGDAQPFFRVHLASGLVLRVSIEPEVPSQG